VDDTFAKRLGQMLSLRGLTQSGLAGRLGVTPAAVSSWVNGKPPGRASLLQIAEVLDVPADYLVSGRGELPVDVAGLRADYRRNLSLYARPAPVDGGREFGNVAEHAFELSLPRLAREVGQNSSDELVDGGTGVRMEFSIIELTGRTLAEFEDTILWQEYRAHLEAAAKDTRRKAARGIATALKRLDEDRRMVLLRIDDYGANGLTGSEYDRSRFTAVLRNQLDSQKGAAGGGSFGLGKNAMWGCSEFSLVLANSRLSIPEDGQAEDRFFGRGQLPAHSLGGREYAGPVWLGQPDPSRTDPASGTAVVRSIFGNPVLAEDAHLKREGDDPGTSFLVVGFHDPSGEAESLEDMAQTLIDGMADNFWAAMTPRPEGEPKLRVAVRTQRDGRVTSDRAIEHGARKGGFVHAYEKHLADETVDDVEPLLQPGDVLRLRVPLQVPARISEDDSHGKTEHEATVLVRLARPDEDRVGHVVWLRGNLMTIQEQRVSALPVGAAPFHAVVLAGRAAGDDAAAQAAERFLRAAEPPQHDKWIATGDLTTSYARGAKTALYNFQVAVLRAVREAVSRPDKGKSDGPSDLKNLLRIGAPPQTTGGRPTVKTVSGGPTADGAWAVEATVSLPPPKRKSLTEWRLSPVLRFATESGAAIGVRWATLEGVQNCRVENGQLVAPVATRTLKFRGVTDPTTHPVAAARAKVQVDVRVQGEVTA
jgi:transcriptional regulator with XRE-family HTH domain